MRLTYTLIFAVAMAATLGGCHGVFDGIYDEPALDAQWQEGFAAAEASNPNRYTLRLNATGYDQWIYIDLHTRQIVRHDIPDTLSRPWDGRSGVTHNLVEGSRYTYLDMRQTDPQPEPEAWDLAIHHFDVRTHGGTALETTLTDISRASAAMAADGNFETDIWSDRHVITDLNEMMGLKIGYQNSWVNPVLSGWVKMDISTPPPVYTSSGHVYLLRLSDNTLAALKMRNYMSDQGTKGYLTIDVVYPL